MFEAHLYPKEPLNRSRIAGFVIALTLHVGAFIWVTAYVSDDFFSDDNNENIAIPVEFTKIIKPSLPAPSVSRDKSALKSQSHLAAQITPPKAPTALPAKSLENANTPVMPNDGLNTEIMGALVGEDTDPVNLAQYGSQATNNGSGNGGGSGDGSGDGSGNGSGEIRIYKLKPKYNPPPNYPRQSLIYNQQGVVVLLLKVGADGTPIEAKVMKSSGFPILDENAKRHVLAKWRFYPAMEQGVPISAYVLAEQIYNINNYPN
jgi:TonB family protein